MNNKPNARMDSNGHVTGLHTESSTARRICFPEEELERQRINAIKRRESVIQDWLFHQSTEDLLTLLSEGANKYGFVCAHSDSLRVQKKVLSAGMANSAETLHWLTMSEYDEISSPAQELWDTMIEEYPNVVYGFIADTLHEMW